MPDSAFPFPEFFLNFDEERASVLTAKKARDCPEQVPCSGIRRAACSSLEGASARRRPPRARGRSPAPPGQVTAGPDARDACARAEPPVAVPDARVRQLQAGAPRRADLSASAGSCYDAPHDSRTDLAKAGVERKRATKEGRRGRGIAERGVAPRMGRPP